MVMLFELGELLIDIGMRMWRIRRKNKVDKRKDNVDNISARNEVFLAMFD